MSWRQTGTYWVIFAVLGFFAFVMDRGEEPTGSGEQVPKIALVDAFIDDVEELSITRDEGRIVCRRVNGRWAAVEPPGATVTHDLIAAFIGSFTEEQQTGIAAEHLEKDRLVEFGLDPPRSVVELVLKGGKRERVDLGAENPTRTALYARRPDKGRVYVAGLNVSYYGELLFENAYPQRGAAAATEAPEIPSPVVMPGADPEAESLPIDESVEIAPSSEEMAQEAPPSST